MHKKTNIFLVAILGLFLLVGTAQAQSNGLPDPGMLPDSHFYFMKSWSESVVTLFTFGDVPKADRFVQLSEKRLAEADALAAKGKPDQVEKTISRYQDNLENALAKADEAKAKGQDTDEVMAKVAEATLKHITVLADVYEKVPEQAKQAIERAMQASKRGNEEALKAISGQKRDEIKQEIDQRKQEAGTKLDALRNKGAAVPAISNGEDGQEKAPAGPQGRTVPAHP